MSVSEETHSRVHSRSSGRDREFPSVSTAHHSSVGASSLRSYDGSRRRRQSSRLYGGLALPGTFDARRVDSSSLGILAAPQFPPAYAESSSSDEDNDAGDDGFSEPSMGQRMHFDEPSGSIVMPPVDPAEQNHDSMSSDEAVPQPSAEPATLSHTTTAPLAVSGDNESSVTGGRLTAAEERALGGATGARTSLRTVHTTDSHHGYHSVHGIIDELDPLPPSSATSAAATISPEIMARSPGVVWDHVRHTTEDDISKDGTHEYSKGSQTASPVFQPHSLSGRREPDHHSHRRKHPSESASVDPEDSADVSVRVVDGGSGAIGVRSSDVAIDENDLDHQREDSSKHTTSEWSRSRSATESAMGDHRYHEYDGQLQRPESGLTSAQTMRGWQGATMTGAVPAAVVGRRAAPESHFEAFLRRQRKKQQGSSVERERLLKVPVSSSSAVVAQSSGKVTTAMGSTTQSVRFRSPSGTIRPDAERSGLPEAQSDLGLNIGLAGRNQAHSLEAGSTALKDELQTVRQLSVRRMELGRDASDLGGSERSPRTDALGRRVSGLGRLLGRKSPEEKDGALKERLIQEEGGMAVNGSTDYRDGHNHRYQPAVISSSLKDHTMDHPKHAYYNTEPDVHLNSSITSSSVALKNGSPYDSRQFKPNSDAVAAMEARLYHSTFLQTRQSIPFSEGGTAIGNSIDPYAKDGHHFLTNRKEKEKFERLNFNTLESEWIHRMNWEKGKQSRRGIQKWLFCLVIGAGTGICMFLVSMSVEKLQGLNLELARKRFKNVSFLAGFLSYLLFNFSCALISCMLVALISPQAAGSGIPDVKAWLNGTYVPKLLEMKAFAVKLIGVVFSVSGSFVIGKEGPMVHSGAAIASGVSLGRNKALGLEFAHGHSFRNDADARDLISCGAAAGVAAAFGAPVGGMLFALEEVSSFWQPGLTWRTFFSAAVSNLVLQLLLGCSHNNCGTVSKSSLIDFGKGGVTTKKLQEGLFDMKQFAFFLIMGVFGGLFGALFNHINKRLCQWRKKNLSSSPGRKIVEVLAVSLLTTSLLLFPLLLYDCRKNRDKNTGSSWNINKGRFTCEEGYHNPLSSLLFGRSEDIISGLFHYTEYDEDKTDSPSLAPSMSPTQYPSQMVPPAEENNSNDSDNLSDSSYYEYYAAYLDFSSYPRDTAIGRIYRELNDEDNDDDDNDDSDRWPRYGIRECFVAFAVYFTLAVVTYGISIPSGLFIPLILTGSTFGYACGRLWNALLGTGFDLGTFSLMGASAFLGGATRMTISLTAILLEITNDIYFLMPIMITVIISKFVGDRFNSALYDIHVALKDMPYLEAKVPSWVPSYITAEDIMNPSVITLPMICSLETVINVLNQKTNSHSAFPVLGHPIDRPQVLHAIQRQRAMIPDLDQYMIEEDEMNLRSGTEKFGWNQKDAICVGKILRWHILLLLKKKHYASSVKELKKLPILSEREMTDDREWKHKKKINIERDLGLKRYELSINYIDLSPYMYLSPQTTSKHTPINRVHALFRGLGLRHLIVLDENQRIDGIITAHELEEEALHECVERVRVKFEQTQNEALNPDAPEKLFDQRIKFLKRKVGYLTSSGNQWRDEFREGTLKRYKEFERSHYFEE